MGSKYSSYARVICYFYISKFILLTKRHLGYDIIKQNFEETFFARKNYDHSSIVKSNIIEKIHVAKKLTLFISRNINPNFMRNLILQFDDPAAMSFSDGFTKYPASLNFSIHARCVDRLWQDITSLLLQVTFVTNENIKNVLFFGQAVSIVRKMKNLTHSRAMLKNTDYLTFIFYQLQVVPNEFWWTDRFYTPKFLEKVRLLILYGYASMLIFGIFSNIGAILFSLYLFLVPKIKISLVFLILAVTDIMATTFNILPIYVETTVANEQKLVADMRLQNLKHDTVEKVYRKAISTSWELQSTLWCKLVEYLTNFFRACSGWLVLLLTFYRLMAISSPIKWKNVSHWKFFKNCFLLMLILALVLSFPLFTKILIEKPVGRNFSIKMCHHKNILGIEFFEFEKMFTALVFPLLPCTLIFPMNMLLLYFNFKGKESLRSNLSNKQRIGKLHFPRVHITYEYRPRA